MQRNNTAQGMILFTMLLFLQLLALLGLAAVLNINLVLKRLIFAWQREDFVQQGMAVLAQLESQAIRHLPYCIIPVTSSRILSEKPLSWWATSTCHDNSNQIEYYYVIEKLGTNFCASMRKEGENQAFAANYYRITLNVLPIKQGFTSLKWQTTLTIPSDEPINCSSPYQVSWGRQSWREI